MAEHQLKPGRASISALVDLGHALGYTPETEFGIPGGTAAVDVAWFRERSDPFPLLLFEVESTPGSGLTTNAMKVLGRGAELEMKPLHFFQLIVKGGLESARPRLADAEFGGHNYSVHALAEAAEPRQFLEAVLRVHRRVSDRLDGVALARSLRTGVWPDDLVEGILLVAEQVGFRGLSERTYVLLAAEEEIWWPSLRRKLITLWTPQLNGSEPPPNRYYEPPEPREEPYGSYLSAASCEPLELGLIARLEPTQAEKTFEVLRDWQQLNHIGDRVGEFTGVGSQWTEYAVGQLGYMWALVAALFDDVPGARAWCAAQPGALLAEVERGSAPDIPLLANWVMHIAAGVEEARTSYDAAREVVAAWGGLAKDWLAAPEPASPGEDGDWESIYPQERGLAPSALELRELVVASGAEAADPVRLALSALLEDPVYRPMDGPALVASLAAMTGTRSAGDLGTSSNGA